MRQNFKKILALVVCVMLCIPTVICNFGVVADSNTKSSTNLLSGLIPYTFITVNDGTTTFSWTDMYVDSTSSQKKAMIKVLHLRVIVKTFQ